MAITAFAYGGQNEREICHITGAVDVGDGNVPTGLVTTVSRSDYQDHIDHGDPEFWNVVTLNDGSKVCVDEEHYAALLKEIYPQDYDVDGVLNADDKCHETVVGQAVNEQGCSVGDICDCWYPWKNHGEYVSCVTKTSQDFVKAGLISNKEKSDYVTAAANNECTILGDDIPFIDEHYGDPYHPHLKRAKDTFEISFVVTGDPQFWNMYDLEHCGPVPTDRLLASQKTVEEMRASCRNADPDCMGAFVAGDLTQLSSVPGVIAFRQLFEYGYPGYDPGSSHCHLGKVEPLLYNWGTKLNYPMFTLIGNHDDPTEDPHGPYVQEYINDLVTGNELYKFPIEKRVAGTAPPSFHEGNYAWEWGSFNFISLGLWAFDGGHGFDGADQSKLEWLKEYLASVGHERAIVLFQHYGWDGFSIGRWWSSDNAKQLVNVLCNRDDWGEPCGTVEKPRYNITGVFSGHAHEAKHHNIYTNDDHTGVIWHNYIVNDAGPGSDVLDENGNCPGDCSTGYTMVHLNVWPAGTERHTDSQVTVTNYGLSNWDFDWDWHFLSVPTNETTYDWGIHNTYTQTGTTSGLTTWDQGEPNGGSRENCATFKTNGRFNDLDCSTHLHFVCRETDPVTKTSHLLIVEDVAGAWQHGEFVCEDHGELIGKNWTFSLPKTFEEQAHLLNMIIDSSDFSDVWVNYSDQLNEGHWIVYPMDYFYFEAGQPNNGDQFLSNQFQADVHHDEDCAVINANGKLEDRRCENEMHGYVCKDHEGWYIHPEKGMWRQAFDDDKCGERGFLFPADEHELQQMFNDLKDDLIAFGSAWISLNDIIEEGHWVNVNWKNACWGLDTAGEATLPSAVYRQITSGSNFSCGRKLDGTVECWGNDDYHQVSDAPVDVTFLQIDAGVQHICGVKKDKTVACWGDDDNHQVSGTPGGLFRQVTAGQNFSCGVQHDGKVECWGDVHPDSPDGAFHQIDAGPGFQGSENDICGIRDELWPTQFEGYWKLDEGSGTTTADFSANSYDGTLEYSPTWSSDTPNTNFDNPSSLSFDRDDHDYVSIPGTTNIGELSKFTISTWVNLTSTPTRDGWTSMRFITVGDEKAVLRYYDNKGTSKLQFYIKKADDTYSSLVVDLPWGTDTWNHIAGTYDGSTMRLYLNGMEQGNGDVSGTLTTGDGVLLSYPGGGSLDGLLDDVRIYNRALPSREIQALAAGDLGSSGVVECWENNTTGWFKAGDSEFRQVSVGGYHTCGVNKSDKVECWGSENIHGQLYAPSGNFSQISAGNNHTCGLYTRSPGLFAGYWDLDEGSGTIAADFSANGYDGTLGLKTTWSGDTAPTSFPNTNSLHFDRADHDYVTITDTPNIDRLSEFSLSAWVKLDSTPTSEDRTYMHFISLGNHKAVLRYLDSGGVGYLNFFMKEDSGSIANVYGAHAWETGVWTHVAATFNESPNADKWMRLYLNGVELHKEFMANNASATGDGLTLSAPGDESLDGSLDDVRIYNRALSFREIQALAAGEEVGDQGELACWGKDNEFQVTGVPSGAWDQVSAGGDTSCSTEVFIHPWEDDFAPGQKYNADRDCAEIRTFMEYGKKTGKFYDRVCTDSLQESHFACRVIGGGWGLIESEFALGPWSEGYRLCYEGDSRTWGTYGKFDVPVTAADNERLIALIWDKLGENARVWVNYSDARVEGQWRHTISENWASGQPEGGGRCAYIAGSGPFGVFGGRWTNTNCDDNHYYVCELPDHNYEPQHYVGVGNWFDALEDCETRGGVMVLPTPDNGYYYWNSTDFIRDPWIRYTDYDYPGRWEDWFYGD
jgi:hypothetical protein